jgi:hypothetical protein
MSNNKCIFRSDLWGIVNSLDALTHADLAQLLPPDGRQGLTKISCLRTMLPIRTFRAGTLSNCGGRVKTITTKGMYSILHVSLQVFNGGDCSNCGLLGCASWLGRVQGVSVEGIHRQRSESGDPCRLTFICYKMATGVENRFQETHVTKFLVAFSLCYHTSDVYNLTPWGRDLTLSCRLRDPKAHYRVQKTQPQVPILSSHHISPRSVLILFSSRPAYPMRPFSTHSRLKFGIHFWYISCMLYNPAHLSILELTTLKLFRQENKLWNYSLCSFLQPRGISTF